MDTIILFPTEPNDSVFVAGQEQFIPPVVVNIKDVFDKLYTQWRDQTKFDSFIGNSTDSCHEKMIQLGYSAVPFIIHKVKTEHAHLFIALNRITGKNPVKQENRGNVKKMAEDWIQWWDEQTYDMG